MLTAISRYGARVPPGIEAIVRECRDAGTLIEGPAIGEFEQAFAARLGVARAFTASYGRMAFLYLLRALDLPAGSEIVFPALTFWVVPEMARVAGLRPVFADVDPETFTLDPDDLERVITNRTRAVVPTHLYGLPCEMDRIGEIAGRHGLAVIEDCAHALGARYRGRPVGTFGDAAFFSLQLLKPLNTCGGGIGVAGDPSVAERAAELAAAEPWPSEDRVLRRFRVSRLQQIFMRPSVFTVTGFPILWVSSWLRRKPDVYLWESIRPLTPLPEDYTERYANVQAMVGLRALPLVDEWTTRTIGHADRVTAALRQSPALHPPPTPPHRTHVYYQYALHCAKRDELVWRAIRCGLDVETLHVDVCTRLELFGDARRQAPGAERAAETVQVPVYASLSDRQVDAVIARLRTAARRQSA
jgi:dTDP-4-amino-4,6-dideoxygalactose transaminase